MLDAAAEPDEQVRSALLDEQLAEFDGPGRALGRGSSRVRPASRRARAFSLRRSLMLQGLAVPAGDDFAVGFHSALMSALSSLSLGIAGTAFCVAVHFRLDAAREGRLAIADRLVQTLLG